MRLMLIALTMGVFALPVAAEINESTRYLMVAETLEEQFVTNGFPSETFEVSISDPGEGMTYFITWHDEVYGDSDSDLMMLLISLASTSGLAAVTDWTATEIQIGFDNLLYTVQVEDAVWLYENMSAITEAEFMEWLETTPVVTEY